MKKPYSVITALNTLNIWEDNMCSNAAGSKGNDLNYTHVIKITILWVEESIKVGIDGPENFLSFAKS